MSVVLQAACVALLAVGACHDDAYVTGVRLTVLYGQGTPARLRVVGSTQDGRKLGPSLLPDPQRPLAPERESVIVQLGDELHGSVLTFDVIGLDASGTPQMRGSAQIEVARAVVQPLFVALRFGVDCPAGAGLSARGDCVYFENDGDVSLEIDAGCGSLCTTEGSAATNSGSSTDDEGVLVEGAEGDAASPPDAGNLDSADAGPAQPLACDTSCASCDTGCCADGCGENDCHHVCEACSCAYTCKAASGHCEIDCKNGSSCDVQCDSAHECKPTCTSGSSCNIACMNADVCKPTCKGDADCHVTCSNGDCSQIECDDGARCLLECASGDCDFNHCSGGSGVTRCAGGILVCNRDCPADNL